MALFSIGQIWADDPVEVTINFGTTTDYWAAHSADGTNDTYTDSDNRVWTRTCAVSNRSGQAAYSQFGNASNACTSLEFSATAGAAIDVSAFSVTMAGASGGSSPTTGTIYLYKRPSAGDDVQLATASVSGTTSVTCAITAAASFSSTDQLVVSYVGTAKAIRVSTLSYTYTPAGGAPTPSVLVSPTSWNFGTVHASDAASKVFSVSGSNLTAGDLTLTVPAGFSVSPSSIAVDGTLAATEVTVSKNTSTEDNYAGNLEITGGGLASAKTVALTMTVDADPAPTGTFEPFSENIEEGDYLIVADGAGMNTTVTSNRLQYTALTLTGENYVNPDVSVIWHIAASATEGYWTIYNEDDGKYAAATSSNNQAQMLASGTDDKSLWTITHSGAAYTIQNKSNSRYLKKNGTYGYGCYADGTVSLYKLSNGKEAAGLAYDAADAQKLVKVGGSLDAPTLTNPNSLAVSYASGNTDVVEVNASTGAITAIKAAGKAVITASTEGDATHNPGSASYTIFVAEQAGTSADPLTEASAKTLIDNGCTLTAHVTGTIATATYNSTYFNYAVTLTDGFQFYRLKDLGNADFSSDYLNIGDEVTAVGALKKFSSTYELDEGCYLTAYTPGSTAVTGVTLTESTAEVEVGSTVTLHASVEPISATNKTIVWSVQSGSDKASVDENGVVTGVAAGEAVIRAASDEDASIYDECTVTVTAVDPTKHTVTFDATVDKGESPLSKDNVTFACSNGVLNNESEYRLYKNSETTFACSDGNITKIEFTGVSGNPVSGFEAPAEGTLVTDGNNGVWTGNAASVTFVASGAQVRATEINVTYKEDSRAESGLAWNPADDIEITVGDAFTPRALLNPNGIDAAEITIESSNPSLATVTAGVVELVDAATGTTTITATFAGNATYKPATISYNITVNGAPLTDYYEKVASGTIAEGTYLIVYEEGSLAFNGGLATLDAESNTIAVDITSDNKIGVTSATEAATFYIDPTAGTVKSASGNFIGVGSWSNGLKQDKEYAHNVLEIDGDGNAQIGIYNADWNTTGGTMRLQYNKSSGQTRFRYYKNGGQQLIALYKLANEVIKPASGLAWDPADDIEITVGDAFTPRTLLNPNGIDAAEITIESSNPSLATVTAGVVELVADATGTATITATFAGNDDYKAATISYKIKVNPAASIYVSPGLNVNFGSVAKDAALPDDKTITVTLNNVAAATATLGGTNPEAFSVDKTALTASGDITISVESSATVGEFKATLTISDDAGAAASKEVKLSFTVTDPASEETPISTSTKWVAAVAADLVDGAEVLITGVKDEVTYAMGEQKSTNRAAYVATIDGEGVLTPGEGTMAFTLVDQLDGTFALRTSNGKYLYAANASNNHLKTQDEVDVNAKWTLTIASAVAEGSSNRNVMQFNGGSSKLFSCYASASQQPIALYVPQTTPPAPSYETVRSGLETGRYYTTCQEKKIIAVKGATFWTLRHRNEAGDLAYLEEESVPFVAGTPFIIQATADKLEVVFEADEVSAPVANGALRGTFNDMDNAALADAQTAAGTTLYLLSHNELRPISTNNHLDAHRAYILYNALTVSTPSPAPGKRVVAMPMQKDAATGIDEITNDQLQMTNKVIIDGHLFIIRGEKMYNANGQLVK